MRKLIKLLIVGLSLTVILNCQKKDDGGQGGSFATTPQGPAQNCADINNPACVPPNPNFYQQNAPQFLNYQWTYTGGYCGCPVGYRPVFNSGWGLACSPANWFPNFAYYNVAAINVQSLFNVPQNGQWTSIPQVTYSPATSGNASNCGAQASLICDTRVQNSCSNGGTCRPVSGGTYLGLCTIGVGNESYYHSQPNNGCLQYNGWTWVNVCQGYGGGFQHPGVLPR